MALKCLLEDGAVRYNAPELNERAKVAPGMVELLFGTVENLTIESVLREARSQLWSKRDSSMGLVGDASIRMIAGHFVSMQHLYRPVFASSLAEQLHEKLFALFLPMNIVTISSIVGPSIDPAVKERMASDITERVASDIRMHLGQEDELTLELVIDVVRKAATSAVGESGLSEGP